MTVRLFIIMGVLFTVPANTEPSIVKKIICKESSGNPKAISHKGARGLIQVMPRTANEIHLKLFKTPISKKDLLDPYKNLAIGQAYLLQLLWEYKGNWEKALTAYNAGPTKARKSPKSKYANSILKGDPCSP